MRREAAPGASDFIYDRTTPELDAVGRVLHYMAEIRSYTHMTRRFAKYSLTGVLALLTLVVLVIGGKPDSAQAAQVKCPQFRVMHNDRIGNVSFPAGYYDVTILNGDRLSCASSTKLFQEFLQDWDGRLRSPWILWQNGNKRVFRAGAATMRTNAASPSGSNTSAERRPAEHSPTHAPHAWQRSSSSPAVSSRTPPWLFATPRLRHS